MMAVDSCFADDTAEIKKKKKKPTVNGIDHKSQLGFDNVDSFKKTVPVIRHSMRLPNLDGSFILKENFMQETKEVTFSC